MTTSDDHADDPLFDGKLAPILPTARPRHAGGVLVTAMSEGLVLLDTWTAQCHLLNPSAGAVWELLDGRRTVDQIVDAVLAAVPGAGPDIGREVIEVLATFRDRALIDLGEATSVPRPADRRVRWHPSPARARWAAVVASGLTARDDLWSVGARRLADATVEVRADNQELVEHLTTLTASLPLTPTAAHDLVLLDRGQDGLRRHRVVLDGEVLGAHAEVDAAVAQVVTVLNRLAVTGTPDRVLLHGGAVERDGAAMVIVGVGGAGKSTVVAALLGRGFAFLSDELVPIDPRDRDVLAYPKPLSLDAPSRALVGLDEVGGPSPDVVPAALAGRISVGASAALLVVLEAPPMPFPHDGVAPQPLAVAQLMPVAALVELTRNTFEETFAHPDALDALADLVEAVPTFRVSGHHDVPLDELCDRLEALFADQVAHGRSTG